MLKNRTFRARHLEGWNSKMTKDDVVPQVDHVVEAVMYDQGIPVNHTSEYRSIYRYDRLWEGLTQFDRSDLHRHDDVLLAGLNASYSIFCRPEHMDRIHPISLLEESSLLFNLLGLKEDRSAGLTSYGMTKLEAFTIALDKAVDILVNDKVPSPCLAGVRTQRKEKTRLVWQYPLELTLLEALIARPLINYFKATDHVMTFGDFSLETGMRLRRCAAEYKYHYSIDYSQFDASVSSIFIRYAFNAFRTWFYLDDEVYPGVTLGKVFDIVQRYFIFTPIVMPMRGATYPVLVNGKQSGVPSGSYFTQIIDSFTNVSLIMAASKRFKLGVTTRNLFVLGDDCLFFSNAKVDVKTIGEFVSIFGFKVNLEKGSHGVSTMDVEYLGRKWRNGFPIRSFDEISRGALYPENYRRYSPERGTRQEQALSVLSSYLLTSYLEEGSPVGTDVFKTAFAVSPWMQTGLTKFLISEGLVPGKILKRAIY